MIKHIGMNEFFDGMTKKIQLKIKDIESEEKDILKRTFSIIVVLSKANMQLKDYVMDYEFRDVQEEIYFFKRQKPSLVSQYIYYCRVYEIELRRPIGGIEVQREYLNRELEALYEYILYGQEFYSYYRLGASHNDECYFTRNESGLERHYPEPALSEREPRYSTCFDYRVARIMANEKLENLLKSALEELDRPRREIEETLPWSLKKTYLIELLYALDSIHAFGKVPLKRVVAVMQKLTGVDLGNVSGAFADMRIRNQPTPFLDALKESLLCRMKRNKRKNTKKTHYEQD